VRALGPRFGLAAAGLASGFVSSVATIGAMGGSARSNPATMQGAIAGATLSSLATFVQMGIVLAAVSRPTLAVLAPALLAGGAVIAIYGGLYGWRAANSPATIASAAADSSAGGAFNLKTALLMVAGMAGILLLTATMQPLFGGAGVTIGAALGGIVDTHAAAMSVAALVAANRLPADAAVVPVLAAMTANATMKISMALGTGGPAYALRIGTGVALSMIATWAVALLR
jgi:uncharacterized membrane protein (DUF4010 family)